MSVLKTPQRARDAVDRYQRRHPERLKARKQRYLRQHPEKPKKWRRQRQQKFHHFIQEYKLARGCLDCGYRDHADALQFDHVRGTKLRSPSTIPGSLPALKVELAKCDVRCANCHAIRSAQQQRSRLGIIEAASNIQLRLELKVMGLIYQTPTWYNSCADCGGTA